MSTPAELPHRPDKATAIALLTAWRSEGPNLEQPESYRTEGLRDLLNLASMGANSWDVLLGLLALANQLLVYGAEATKGDADALLATIAQMDAEQGA